MIDRGEPGSPAVERAPFIVAGLRRRIRQACVEPVVA